MATLKETKNRIGSVQNTLKITSAMKLIASAKFHQAQVAIKKVQAYEESVQSIFQSLLDGREEQELALHLDRPVKRMILVPFSSDTGLCGSFNSNIIKEVETLIAKYRSEGLEVEVYPVGEKITQAMLKGGFPVREEGRRLLDKPTMAKCTDFTSALLKRYRSGETDTVALVYHRFKSTTRQVITEQTLLPLERPKNQEGDVPQTIKTEPNPVAYLRYLYPHVLSTTLYRVISESLVSEQAARMTAMQVATDNANDLLKELNILYNKTRQQAITNEILDLVGGRIRQHS